MKTRNLSQNLTVSSIGFGGMGLSEFYGQTNDYASLEVLHKLIELNVTFIDTANLYGRGHNERLIGHFLAGLDKSTTNPTISSVAVTNPLSALALSASISFTFTE